jgi:hypothetical protein
MQTALESVQDLPTKFGNQGHLSIDVYANVNIC